MNREKEPAAKAPAVPRVVIIGAGPAGVRAAQTLVEAGLRPVLIDENRRAGGQIYRQPPPGFVRDKRTLYGFEAKRAASVHDTFTALLPSLDYLPDTLAWHCSDNTLDLLSAPATLSTQPYSHLLLCTGALDRTLPFAGWTLPGVYTLGAAQVALKAQGCAIGECVVLAGAGPLLYLVAYQYARAGARVAAVLDIGSFADRAGAAGDLLALPAVLAQGLYYLGWLRAHSIAIHSGVREIAATGTQRITGVRWRDARGSEHALACDALASGFGLRSETQLADLAGCAFEFNALNRQWLPRREPSGRSSVAGVYLAGDGSGIAGAHAAELGGRRAALALLEDLGHPVEAQQARALEARLRRIARFRRGLEQAFPMPVHWARKASDDAIVCRCEEITAGELRAAVQVGGVREMNRLKALCRAGMGRCQGRICSTAAAEILSEQSGLAIEAVGRWRAQPPLKPLPVLAALNAVPAPPDAAPPARETGDAPAVVRPAQTEPLP